MMLADFSPGIFFLLLWGLISWLTSKKKKKIGTDSLEVTAKPKEDLFARLRKLQEHLSQEVDIFPSSSLPLDAEEDKYGFEEPEILEPTTEDAIVEINERFTKVLEETVREYPEQYFWFHRKWNREMYKGISRY